MAAYCKPKEIIIKNGIIFREDTEYFCDKINDYFVSVKHPVGWDVEFDVSEFFENFTVCNKQNVTLVVEFTMKNRMCEKHNIQCSTKEEAESILNNLIEEYSGMTTDVFEFNNCIFKMVEISHINTYIKI